MIKTVHIHSFFFLVHFFIDTKISIQWCSQIVKVHLKEFKKVIVPVYHHLA